MVYSKYVDNWYENTFKTRPLESAYMYVFTDGTNISGYEGNYNNIRFRMSNAFGYAKSNNKTLAYVYKQVSVDDFLMIVPSYYDFVYMDIVNTEHRLNVQHVNLTISQSINGDSINYQSEDYLPIGQYQMADYFNYFNDDWAYDNYYAYPENACAVYDFSNLENDTMYRYENGYAFHTHALCYTVEDWGLDYDIQVGLGSVYSHIRQEGYDEGKSAGYNQGKQDGYQEGLRDGQAMADMTPENATAFSYIGHAFEAVGNVLSIEVLPHITIGTCFSIPLVLILIMTIFKLVRK